MTRHRADDIKMPSVWVRSRDDIIANTAMLAAEGLVAFTNSPWPDIVVGLGITVLFFKSGIGVVARASRELAHEPEMGARK